MKRIWGGYWDSTFAEPLSFPASEGHGLLCGGVRKGKARDYLIQMLLSFEGSMFVVDPKLQLCAVTARYRRDVLKQDVCVLNPFNVFSESYLRDVRHAKYDPLKSKLDPKSPSFAADADNLLEGLMLHGGPEVHWVDTARQLGSGGAMHLRTDFLGASLASLYKVVSSRNLHKFCEDAVASKDDFKIGRLDRFTEDAKDNRELRSVISTAVTQLGFMANGPIADSFSESTVDFRPMRHRPMTVFVGLPGRRLASCSKWITTIVNSWADDMLEEGRGAVDVLGILDEFKSTVGRIGSIETLLGMGAGYGTTLLAVIRDLPELQELTKAWETWLANTAFKIFLSPRDHTTAQYLSRMTGTAEVHSLSKSFGRSVSMSAGSQGKAYMLPEEIREMSDNEALVWADGVPGVIKAGRRPYYEEAAFAGKFDVDPYHDYAKTKS